MNRLTTSLYGYVSRKNHITQTFKAFVHWLKTNRPLYSSALSSYIYNLSKTTLIVPTKDTHRAIHITQLHIACSLFCMHIWCILPFVDDMSEPYIVIYTVAMIFLYSSVALLKYQTEMGQIGAQSEIQNDNKKWTSKEFWKQHTVSFRWHRKNR